METKRITDLTILESLSDAANVLVEENGEAKRVPAGNLGGASSWNDLTDKPFWAAETVVLEEQELAPNPDMGGFCVGSVSAAISVGDNLTVVLDGTAYSVEVVDAKSMPYFGNLSMVGAGADTGEPFCGTYMDGQVAVMCGDGANHTVRISVITLEKLDPKYYDAQAVFYLNAPYLYTDLGKTVKATKADVLSAAKRMPIVIIADDQHFTPICVDTRNDYATVWLYVTALEGDQLMQAKYYTAEYTPETT